MWKDRLNKIEFNNPKEPIDLFFTKPYNKDYYLRGQIEQKKFRICHFQGNPFDKEISLYYYVTFLVLVNDNYLKRYYKNYGTTPMVGSFYGRTEKDFLRLRKKYDRDAKQQIRREIGKSRKKYISFLIEQVTRHNRPLIIDINEVEVQKTSYLKRSIKAGKNIILLDINMAFVREKPQTEYSQKIDYDINRKYALAFRLLASPDCCYDDIVSYNFDYELFRIVTVNIDHNLTTINDFFGLVSDINTLISECYNKRSIFKKYLNLLNKILQLRKEADCPLRNFLFSIFTDFITYLEAKRKIKRCPVCNLYFRYKKGKPACNLKDDGRNCIEKLSEIEKNPTIKKLQKILNECNIEEKLTLEQASKLCTFVLPELHPFLREIRKRLQKELKGQPKGKRLDILYDMYADFKIRRAFNISEDTFIRKMEAKVEKFCKRKTRFQKK